MFRSKFIGPYAYLCPNRFGYPVKGVSANSSERPPLISLVTPFVGRNEVHAPIRTADCRVRSSEWRRRDHSQQIRSTRHTPRDRILLPRRHPATNTIITGLGSTALPPSPATNRSTLRNAAGAVLVLFRPSVLLCCCACCAAAVGASVLRCFCSRSANSLAAG